MAGRVLIGISGWRYAPWRGVFYPDGLKQSDELAYAAARFATIEINGSFYSLQRPEYYARWQKILIRPFLGEFDYATSTIHDDIKPMIPGVLKRLNSLQAPVEVVFIDRVVGGHYGNLRKIRARGRFIDLVMPFLETAAGSSQPLPSE